MSKERRIYRVIFLSQGERYELYASEIFPNEHYGFVEVAGLLFGEKSGVLVDPSEERLKEEFSGVKSTLIPMHTVIRIDEVEKQGVPKIIEGNGSAGNVAAFPAMPPRGGKE